MGNATVLFAGFDFGKAGNLLEGAFGGKSAAELSLEWASRNGERILVLSLSENSPSLGKLISRLGIGGRTEVSVEEKWSVSAVCSKISEFCGKHSLDGAAFAWIDLPFLSDELTERLLSMHEAYRAEYSFADGYPYGVSPEILDSGAAAIISKMAEGSEERFSRNSIFEALKKEINSFEVETLISDFDYRPLRISLESSSRGGFLSCVRLFEAVSGKNLKIGEICSAASRNPLVLRNLPHFFDVQITSKVNHRPLYAPENAGIGIENLPDMEIGDFRGLLRKILDYAPESVLSLSLFGEPTLHPDFAEFACEAVSSGLRILVETDGISLTEGTIEKICSECGKSPDFAGIDWIVDLDAFSAEFYKKVRLATEEDFSLALETVSRLEERFPGHVYPQMTRMRANEDELEKFFRFWRDPQSPSKGKLIIRKYDSICSKLPDEKSADLSPLVRNPCWHIARDFAVLSDGSVPKCRSCGNSEILGNAFGEDLEEIWGRGLENFSMQVGGKFCGNCGGCDEFYTFSF